MKKIYFLSLLFIPVMNYAQTNVGITGNVAGVYINEIHYDNTGTDAGEFIEVAGPAGTDLSTYVITLYNGSNNTAYTTLPLSGSIDNEGSGVGAVSFLVVIQNGAPDAIALSKTGNTDIQYLSYEGVMTAPAIGGAAAGLNSVDILALEDGFGAAGNSLEYDEASSSWIGISDDTPGVFAQGPILSVASNSIQGLKVYPNPVVNNNLFITSDNNDTKSVVIYDILGKQVLKATVTDQAVNVANLKGGVYIVKITEDGKTATRKLVIK